MSQTIDGYILIADISGYTMFLSESELEHAQGVLEALLEVMIENTTQPLVISRLEGDAVISYAAKDKFLQGTTVIEMIESCYVSFKRAIKLMMINTTCKCQACRNIPNLDLKFFLHFGTFGLQPMPTYTELIGNDVNIVHRLTKNHVTEKTGLKAYALLSQAAVESLGIQSLTQGMQQVTEHYEHIGDVETYVMDMSQVWQREQERTRLIVTPEEAIVVNKFDFPVSQVHLWDYMLRPEYRKIFFSAHSIEPENLQAGRIGEGTIYQCAHGKTVSPQTIVDWQPFETHTVLDETGFAPMYVTYRFAATETGSQLTVLNGQLHTENRLLRFLHPYIMRLFMRLFGKKGVENLRLRMEQDLADGTLQKVEAVEINMEEIASSIRNALMGEEPTPN
jgi:hypothetical protein